MKPPGPPLFLERRSYRRRRLIDAARMLPLVGAFLWAIPLLWGGKGATTSGYVLVFVVWGLLILGAFALARSLAASEAAPRGDTPREG